MDNKFLRSGSTQSIETSRKEFLCFSDFLQFLFHIDTHWGKTRANLAPCFWSSRISEIHFEKTVSLGRRIIDLCKCERRAPNQVIYSYIGIDVASINGARLDFSHVYFIDFVFIKAFPLAKASNFLPILVQPDRRYFIDDVSTNSVRKCRNWILKIILEWISKIRCLLAIILQLTM